MNNCIYIRKRTKGIYCKKINDYITFDDCRFCDTREYKRYENKMKQKSSKLAKAEKDRYSILVDDLDHCIECGRLGTAKHEVFYGTGKRPISIKYGLVIPLCHHNHHNQIECKGIHFDTELCDKWHIIGQRAAMKHYGWSEEDFIKIFGQSYIK